MGREDLESNAVVIGVPNIELEIKDVEEQNYLFPNVTQAVVP